MEALKKTKGRRYNDTEKSLLDGKPFLKDYNSIISSKSFRRLAYKTQALTNIYNPHVRTRLTHTTEVAAVAVTIAEYLGLNVDLCRAIAFGHDIGHTPYGHVGEEVLAELSGKPFKHNVFSSVLAQHIEREGHGLNLCKETLEGIVAHSTSGNDIPVNKNGIQEYSVVRYADKIAGLFSDVNDLIRYGYIKKIELPDYVLDLGEMQHNRIENAIEALVMESLEKEYVSFSDGEVFNNFEKTKKYLYNEIFPKVERNHLIKKLTHVYNYISESELFANCDPVIVCALLSDKEVDKIYKLTKKGKELGLDEKRGIMHLGIYELIPSLREIEVDYNNPDLNWDEHYTSSNIRFFEDKFKEKYKPNETGIYIPNNYGTTGKV